MADTGHPGLIVRQKAPLNLEFQFSSLSSWQTPNDQFYVRNHFPTPVIDPAGWRLSVNGAVTSPLTLSLDDLKAFASVEFAAVMECAGNGRVFYEPAREGLQWQNGAVGNAVWTGVPLGAVLERAGLLADAVEVVLIGTDRGVVDGGKKTASPGPIAFARSMPLEKALSDEVLLAYAMNGEPLTPDHGAPLRAVVGGWYGMAWIKWLAEVHVSRRPFSGYWQARDYFRWDRSLGEPTLVPLTTMEVKAQIARPVGGTRLAVGRPTLVTGAAWSGERRITDVEIKVGSGAWQPARLLPPDSDFGWRLFEFDWIPSEVGRTPLRCRARDESGSTQPEEQHTDRESYGANWIVPVEVEVVQAPAKTDDFVI